MLKKVNKKSLQCLTDNEILSKWKSKAFSALALKDMARYEIRAKIDKSFIIGDEHRELLEEFLNYLEQNKYIDDDKLTENFIKHAIERLKGENYIRSKLEIRGLESNVIDKHISINLDADVAQGIIEKLWKVKFANTDNAENLEDTYIEPSDDYDGYSKNNNYNLKAKKHSKQIRFFLSRGFTYEQVYEFFRKQKKQKKQN